MDQDFIQGLMSLQGKRVKVRLKRRKDVTLSGEQQSAPGTADFYYEDYFGTVLSPAVRTYPEDNPQGILALFVQTWDARQQIYALALESIEEVDDELPIETFKQVGMSGLQNPTQTA